jgi:aspartate/methionine/tyrosine aminotransferase
VAGLNELPGVSCQAPVGAFYAFPDIRGTGLSSRQVADKLLIEGGVALLSGASFGEMGEGYLRISYANSLANIQEGLLRMKKVLSDSQ